MPVGRRVCSPVYHLLSANRTFPTWKGPPGIRRPARSHRHHRRRRNERRRLLNFSTAVRDLTDGFGVDCVPEIAGNPELIPAGLSWGDENHPVFGMKFRTWLLFRPRYHRLVPTLRVGMHTRTLRVRLPKRYGRNKKQTLKFPPKFVPALRGLNSWMGLVLISSGFVTRKPRPQLGLRV